MQDLLNEKLGQAWLLRLNSRVDECSRLFQECKALKNTALTPALSTETQVDLLLLEASLERSGKRLTHSNALIIQAETLLHKNGVTEHFQFYFQSGLNLYLGCDYTQAIDRFISARNASRSELEKAFALTNILLCLEALGLPGTEIYVEVKVLLKHVRGEAASGLTTTLQAYELRSLFRRGLFSQVVPKKLESTTDVTQEDYYRIWVSELPFHRATSTIFLRDKNRFRERLYVANPMFHLKSYRVRTLQVMIHSDDFDNFKVTEFADRLYLWVWKWLADPALCPLERIVSLLENSQLKNLGPRLSAEDFQMVRNALHWLSLFDGTNAAYIQKLTHSLQIPNTIDYPIFEFERLAVQYFTAIRDRKEVSPVLEKLKMHSLWTSEDYLLAKIVREFGSDGKSKIRDILTGNLTLLHENLLNLLMPQDGKDGSELFIDLSNWVIRATEVKKRTVSEPMCLAFHALKSQGSLTFQQILQTSFGISKYVPDIHDSKIFNLLARMREFTPRSLAIKTKQGRIYVTGSWSGIVFSEFQGKMNGELSKIDWRGLMGSKGESKAASKVEAQRWAKPALALKRLQNSGELSRKELEKQIGKSRSTANRIISRWIEQGIVKQIGNAKKTRYVFCPK